MTRRRTRQGRDVAIWGGRERGIRIVRDRRRHVRTRRAFRIRDRRDRDRYQPVWTVPARRRIARRRYVVRDPFVLFERDLARTVYYDDYGPYYYYDERPLFVRRPAPLFSVPYRRANTFQVSFSPFSFAYFSYDRAPYYYPAPVYYDDYYAANQYFVDPYYVVRYDTGPYGGYGYWDPVYAPGYYESGVYFNADQNFYRRHRNLVNLGLATGTGAAIGGIFNGRRGALIGAGIGAAAGAIYTYGIDPKDKRQGT